MDENNKDVKEAMEWIKSILLAVVIALFIKLLYLIPRYVLGNLCIQHYTKEIDFAINPLYFSTPKKEVNSSIENLILQIKTILNG